MLNILSVSTDYSTIIDDEMSLNMTQNATFPREFEEPIDDLFHKPLTLVIFSILYIITFFVGLFGNFLVCYVVARQRTMQTVTNFFITNLAFADILLCLFCVPLTPTYTFLGRWIFGKFLCHLVAFLQCWCVYLSTLTLTSIAIDRFFIIIFPFRPRMKVVTCLCILVLIWIIGFLLTFPYGYYMQIVTVADDGTVGSWCEENWPTEDIRKVFGTVTSIIQFFMPFLIILVCYISIFCKLQKNKKKLSKSKNSKKKNNSEKMLKKKTSTNQMLVMMVAIFGICWLPLNIINILDDFTTNFNELTYYNLMFFTSHLFAMSSVIYNPILYGLLNDNFKKEFKTILPFLFVNISTHPKHPKNFLNSFNRRKNDENLIRNGEKTQQETTFLQPNNDNVMISIETDMNNAGTVTINQKKSENIETNGNITQNGNSQKRVGDNKLLVINGCDEIMTTTTVVTSGSDSRTADSSIS
ncbi:hypothetical protein PVAND_000243 [Polypedilum vanderplanki]|uniref:G-protein coupled receptors family 1 profile domain-containing protein n=1 Tax=Polypedilum vanderplanki TaxID=319348 RepID=A0A9J6BJQ6_POLVA|nr:hypothetical protein PVAND_000243 [Polypedilum vanderplanki]